MGEGFRPIIEIPGPSHLKTTTTKPYSDLIVTVLKSFSTLEGKHAKKYTVISPRHLSSEGRGADGQKRAGLYEADSCFSALPSCCHEGMLAQGVRFSSFQEKPDILILGGGVGGEWL